MRLGDSGFGIVPCTMAGLVARFPLGSVVASTPFTQITLHGHAVLRREDDMTPMRRTGRDPLAGCGTLHEIEEKSEDPGPRMPELG